MSAELNGRLTPTGVLIGQLNTTGGSGTDNYNDLVNKPSINGVTLAGNKTLSDLGINIPTKVSQLQNDSHYVQQSAIPTKTSQLQNDSGLAYAANLATVATTGSYNNLTDKPTIPTKTSQLQNDSNFVTSSSLATVATSGSYDDLTDKPTIPAAQVNADWNSNSGVSEILNKPDLAAVATSGSYDDLTDKPTIPAAQVNSDWNSNSGVSQILNKPSLATVATSGRYNDLTNKPTIPSDYMANGTYNIGTLVIGGWITSGRSDLRFNIYLPKKIQSGKVITLGGKGRMYSNLGISLISNGTNLSDWGTWSFTITDNSIECLCAFDSAFSASDCTNNTLQTIYLESTATLTISD